MTKAGRKPVEIARHLKISESAVSQWFSKDTGPKSVRLADLAAFLNTTVDYLIAEPGGAASPVPPVLPSRGLLDRPDLAVRASAPAGVDGAWLLSNDAIAWMPRDHRLVGVRDAFSCYVVGESMVPAYEPGNLLLVNPAVPPGPGDDCLFVQEAPDGARLAMIRRLVRYNSNAWTVKQWNPDKTLTLGRREWQRALLVIGKYNRG